MKLAPQIISTVVISIAVWMSLALWLPLSFFDRFHENRLGSTITTILGSDTISSSRTVINTNFSNLNTDKLESGSSATSLTILNATTTRLSCLGDCAFGATATSSFSSAGALTLITPLGVASGGTGWASIQTGAIPYGNGTTRFSTTSQGTPGQVLGWVGTTPTWVATTSNIDTTANFSWSGLHLFSRATTTIFSAYQAYFGATATSTFGSDGSLTVNGTFTANGAVSGVAAVASTSVWSNTDTWTKPSGAKVVHVRLWGGGGSGSNGNDTGDSAGGGGGGFYIEGWFNASDLGSTETVTIGAGGGSQTGDTDGAAGGTTSFGTHLTAPGGNGGDYEEAVNTAGGTGGCFSTISITVTTFCGTATAGAAGTDGVYSGGGGGAISAGAGTAGGDSYWGGAGGGGSRADTQNGGTSVKGGNGGASATNAAATAGSIPGGGGGGQSGSGSSGAGGKGKAIITTFF